MDSFQSNSILELIYYNMEITTEHNFMLENQGGSSDGFSLQLDSNRVGKEVQNQSCSPGQ